MSKKIAIFGTSGFAREVADICESCNVFDIVFLEKEADNSALLPYPVMDETVNFDTDVSFAMGIGVGSVREKIYEKYPEYTYKTLVHPSATFGRNQQSKVMSTKGTIIAAGVRMTNEIDIGNFVVLNLNVTVGHDVTIKDFVSVMPGATISGNVIIEEGAYIGTGAIVLNGTNEKKLIIGKSAVVGAGAVVTKSVPAGITVVGMPAKPIQK